MEPPETRGDGLEVLAGEDAELVEPSERAEVEEAGAEAAAGEAQADAFAAGAREGLLLLRGHVGLGLACCQRRHGHGTPSPPEPLGSGSRSVGARGEYAMGVAGRKHRFPGALGPPVAAGANRIAAAGGSPLLGHGPVAIMVAGRVAAWFRAQRSRMSRNRFDRALSTSRSMLVTRRVPMTSCCKTSRAQHLPLSALRTTRTIRAARAVSCGLRSGHAPFTLSGDSMSRTVALY